MKSTLKYVELKTGYSDCGPAWIGYTETSKSGQTIYFNGKALKRIKGGGVSANYYDLETNEEYWVSGVKKNGHDRHWAGSGKIKIEEKAVNEYLEITGDSSINNKMHIVVANFEPNNPAKFLLLENEVLHT